MRRIRRNSFASPISKELTWDIKVEPVVVSGKIAENYKGIVRDDNNSLLNITKKTYHPLTNDGLKKYVFRLAELTGFSFEGFTEFKGGKKILAYLRNNESKLIAGFKANHYMVLGSSFDYTSAIFLGGSSLIARCTNQFGQIIQHRKIRHNSMIEAKLDEMILFYEDYIDQERKSTEKFEEWNGIEIPFELRDMFMNHALEIHPQEKVSTIKQNKKKNLAASVNREIGAMGNNAFGLFNGLTHYTTHVLNTEKVFGNILGNAAEINDRGYKFLTDFQAGGLELVEEVYAENI